MVREVGVTQGPPPDRGELDLEERQALRRVIGLSTELEDITEVEYRQVRLEQVVLVGVWTEGTAADAERSLRELALLAETAGALVLEGVIQRRDRPDPATYIGSGKAQELRQIVVSTGADTVICDGELTPGQLRHLEDVVKVKVVDRTWLILDIFAQHASSKAGRAQVSLAQMEYLLPRLRGWGESLSRQAGGRAGGATGGVGTRGPGETKIETDRRRIRDQMTVLRRQLKDMERVRRTQRSGRRRSGTPAVALAGYTNAGKSSLLNQLAGYEAAIVTPIAGTTRDVLRERIDIDGMPLHVLDTAGLRDDTGDVVEAEGMRRARPEMARADRVLFVIDASADPAAQAFDAERARLPEGVPVTLFFNKADLAANEAIALPATVPPRAVLRISAKTGAGLEIRPECCTEFKLDYDLVQ